MTETEIIHSGINNRTKIKINYKDDWTIIEPYLHGLSRMGDEFIYAKTFHHDGDHFYRFDLDAVNGIKAMTEPFKVDHEYERPVYVNEDYACICT